MQLFIKFYFKDAYIDIIKKLSFCALILIIINLIRLLYGITGTICILEVEEFMDQYTRFTTELCARPILSYELINLKIHFLTISRSKEPETNHLRIFP